MEPLFDLNEIKERAKQLEISKRGSSEEYNKTILNEMIELYDYGKRVRAFVQTENNQK